MDKDNFKIYHTATVQLLKIYFLGLAMCMCFRTALLFSFGSAAELDAYSSDLFRAYWTGFRFDTAVLAYVLLLPFVLNLLILIIPENSLSYYRATRKFMFWYISSVFSILLLILTVDFFFYVFFQSHLNTILFGVVGNTKTILASIWSDYPVIRVLIFIVIITSLLAYAIKKILRSESEISRKNLFHKVLYVVLIICLYVLALRGSIGPVPICRDQDDYISSNLFLNDLAMNGAFAFKEAVEEEHKKKLDTNIASDPTGIYAALEVMGMKPGRSSDGRFDLNNVLFAKTPYNPFLKKHPPHVVFFQMESMSNFYLDLHSRDLNLLGTLEEQLPYCFVFRNFLPSGNNTVQSLEGLLIARSRISLAEAQTSYPDKSFASSVARPFLNSGYQTSFITGDRIRFANLDKFIPKQYFQTIEGEEILSSKVRNTQSGTWGAFDEFLFDRVFDKLAQSGGKPQFIFAVTVTNHTPYDLPSTYRPFPLHISSEIRKTLKVNEDIALKNLSAYQYANDSLGHFLEKLRRSPYADSTIVAATGDHNTLHLFGFPYTHLFQKLSVPLIMYVPAKYRPDVAPDTKRFASHKDIFPSIFNLSLSEATYLNTGINLFDSTSHADYFAINDNKTAMNKDGCVVMQDKPLFYRLQKNKSNLLEPTSLLKTPALDRLWKQARAYTLLMDTYIQSELPK